MNIGTFKDKQTYIRFIQKGNKLQKGRDVKNQRMHFQVKVGLTYILCNQENKFRTRAILLFILQWYKICFLSFSGKITFHITAFSFAISISSPFDMVIIFWSGENVNNDILCFPNGTKDWKQDDKLISIFAKINIVYLILLTRTMILFHCTILYMTTAILFIMFALKVLWFHILVNIKKCYE